MIAVGDSVRITVRTFADVVNFGTNTRALPKPSFPAGSVGNVIAYVHRDEYNRTVYTVLMPSGHEVEVAPWLLELADDR